VQSSPGHHPQLSCKEWPIKWRAPKADKASSPDAKKTMPEFSKPLSPGGAQSTPGADGASSPDATQSPNPTSRRPNESPQADPTNPQPFGLGSIGGPSQGEPSAPRASISARRYSQVKESLAKDPEFVKVWFHISRFITAVVDTVKDRANTNTLYNDLNSPSTQLNISTACLTLHNIF
jgi:hypothetical protein